MKFSADRKNWFRTSGRWKRELQIGTLEGIEAQGSTAGNARRHLLKHVCDNAVDLRQRRALMFTVG